MDKIINIINILSPLLTIITGGGWFYTYRAYRRKADGEATQVEASGWKAMQEVYQRTIEDLKTSCEYIKNDRNLLREENKVLREENNNLRKDMNALVDQVNALRSEVARQGRQLADLNSRKHAKRQLKDEQQ